MQFLPDLTAHRGKLLSGDGKRGRPVHAASFLNERRIVLEEQLILRPSELRLILTHEIMHFVWRRLSNAHRENYRVALTNEYLKRARFELGESASVAKANLSEFDCLSISYAWRNYVCESFCDTGAWLWGGVASHRYFRLARKWREARSKWFNSLPWLRA